jgi:hypothetical protein
MVCMPVYLVFLQVAKKNLQLALRGLNLPGFTCSLQIASRVQFIIISYQSNIRRYTAPFSKLSLASNLRI